MARATVYKARDIIEAGIIVAMLESHDIEAFSVDKHINTMHLGANFFAPVRILVDFENEQKALELIEEYKNN